MAFRLATSFAIGSLLCAAMMAGNAQELTTKEIGAGPDYWPNREKAIPHTSGDRAFSNTYDNWKDRAALEEGKKKGLMSHEMNFKDFRWAEKSFDAEAIVDMGKEIYHRPNAKGTSCASCHGQDGAKIKNVYTRYPVVNKRLNRVVVVPTQIATCATERMGEQWVEDTKPNSLLDFYIASLADGKEIEVDVSSGPMKASYERGRDLFFKRTGHFNFACASCHTPSTVGSYLRGQRPSTFFGDAATYPIWHFPYALAGDDLEYVFTLQHQIKSCQMLSR
ncbi:MAG: sulfur oxidation c-type cytochrome SoxA, partial [Chromatiales bacterium]|nr:sulfur oxidation c-type cytochrome SoxA [Chromatiales bacterium]